MPRGLFSFLFVGVAIAYALYSLFRDDKEDRPSSRPSAPSPHLPSHRRDDQPYRQAIDSYPTVNAYSPRPPQSPPSRIPSYQRDNQFHRQTVDSHPAANAYAPPPRSPSVIPSYQRDDLHHRRTVDSHPAANAYAPRPPRSPSVIPSYRRDDLLQRQTVDSHPAANAYTPRPPRSPSVIPSYRRDDLLQRQTVDSHPAANAYAPHPPRSPPSRTASYQRDDLPHRRTTDSYPTVNIYAPHPPRSPSPHTPSYQHDDWQHSPTVEVDHSVETSESLRTKARQEGNLMSQCYQQSQEAYDRREHALAKKLSEQAKRHVLKMERFDAQASAIVFKENNRDRPTGEVDLHGLYVKEAISYAENAVEEARRRGDFEMRLIVGQGNHSDGGIPRLKPALQEAMEMYGVDVNVDPRNPGVLQIVI